MSDPYESSKSRFLEIARSWSGFAPGAGMDDYWNGLLACVKKHDAVAAEMMERMGKIRQELGAHFKRRLRG